MHTISVEEHTRNQNKVASVREENSWGSEKETSSCLPYYTFRILQYVQILPTQTHILNMHTLLFHKKNVHIIRKHSHQRWESQKQALSRKKRTWPTTSDYCSTNTSDTIRFALEICLWRVKVLSGPFWLYIVYCERNALTVAGALYSIVTFTHGGLLPRVPASDHHFPGLPCDPGFTCHSLLVWNSSFHEGSRCTNPLWQHWQKHLTWGDNVKNSFSAQCYWRPVHSSWKPDWCECRDAWRDSQRNYILLREPWVISYHRACCRTPVVMRKRHRRPFCPLTSAPPFAQ